MLFEIVSSISWQSPSWDEGDHLFAGYMSLKKDDNSLNPEHPPMAKMVAALPLLPLDLKTAPQQGRYFKDEAYFGGRELIYRNGPANGGRYSADTILFRARMAVSVFTFALALLVFFAGWEMFSLPAGVLAMALFAFEPSILANGAYVTTDMTVACMFFAAVFGFYRYVKAPSVSRLLVAGVLAGMCLAAKHSAVLLLPMLIALTIGELLIERRQRSASRASLLRLLGAVTSICALAIFVLWAFYSFRYAMRPDGSAMTPSLAANAAALPAIQAKGILLFAKLHLLPESYLYGLIDVLVVGDFTPSYIFGKVYAHGVWFYFPVVLALKWTIGAMGLFAMALWAVFSGRLNGRLGRPREVLFLTVPPIIYLAAAITSPLNIGVRHILPVFAFLLTLAAGGAWAMVERNSRWGYAVALLLLAHIVSSARVYPNYLPYANELFGGPSKTNYYLTDSAVDWGQQLKAVKQYTDDNHITHCWFAYTVAPFLLPADYGIPCKLLPTADTFGQIDIDVPQTVEGPVLVSYLALNGYEYGTSVRNPYQELFHRQPDAVIRDGVAVFNGSFHLPLASSLQYIHRSGTLLPKDPAGALREARQAVAIAPNDLDPVMAMGDALRASGSKAEAATHYNQAREIVKRMEPSAQKDWNVTLDQRMGSVK
jgi:4-amino-4-deoxy-L-arabinose transferase-like glycosyltransferase